MIAAFLYLLLGAGLMIFLGHYFSRAADEWLSRKLQVEPGAWKTLLSTVWYLIFSGYLLLTVREMTYQSVADLLLGVLSQIAPLMLGLGGILAAMIVLRIRAATRLATR